MITPRFQPCKVVLAVLIAASVSACASTGVRVPKYEPGPSRSKYGPGSGRMAPIPNPPEPEKPRAPPEPPPPPVERHEAPKPEPEKPKPAPPAPPHKATNPAQAAHLRAKGLEQLDRGAINRAVVLLGQALALDPDNPLIKRDLERAERIRKVVHSRR